MTKYIIHTNKIHNPLLGTINDCKNNGGEILIYK